MNFEYRLRRQTEIIGPLALEIECLADLNETIDRLFAELEKTGNAALLEELCPYFGTVWPSARALALTLTELPPSVLRGRRVLELGCGLAVPSLIAARLGAEVVATDFHPEVPRFLTRNIELNGAGENIRYEAVDWKRGFPELGRFDWVIGSDVLYERPHAELLAGVVARYLAPGGEAIVADPARPYLQGFVDTSRALGLDSRTEVRTVTDVPVPKDIFVVHLRHRA